MRSWAHGDERRAVVVRAGVPTRRDAGPHPAEDRLTESFAALLQRVPGLGLHLALHWLYPATRTAGAGERPGDTRAAAMALRAMPPEALHRVATQLSVAGGRVDLELRFAADPLVRADEIVVRVEVKHGIQPHSNQLDVYERTLKAAGRPHAVVLLAPRADLASTDREPVPATYLQEEQLMDPPALRPEHLAACSSWARRARRWR